MKQENSVLLQEKGEAATCTYCSTEQELIFSFYSNKIRHISSFLFVVIYSQRRGRREHKVI
jgi:hypothetical protein